VARILIADDSADVRRLLAATLARNGHHITEVPNGQRALEALMTQPFEVAILDVEMPGVDGLTLCRMLRDAQGLGHLAVIVISGSTSETAALAAGADVFLSKPFLPSNLLKVVASLSATGQGSVEPRSELSHEALDRNAAHPAAHHRVSLDGVR
jgi:CheY-like chemotaxis protein